MIHFLAKVKIALSIYILYIFGIMRQSTIICRQQGFISMDAQSYFGTHKLIGWRKQEYCQGICKLQMMFNIKNDNVPEYLNWLLPGEGRLGSWGTSILDNLSNQLIQCNFFYFL